MIDANDVAIDLDQHPFADKRNEVESIHFVEFAIGDVDEGWDRDTPLSVLTL